MENAEPEASWENLYLEANNDLFALREDNKQAIERWQRLSAEYDNYQKRVKREKESLKAEVTQNVLKNFITVADNLDLLIDNPQLKLLDENLYNGVQLVTSNCKEVFENSGLKKIDPAIGSPFNTEDHRAISTYESSEMAVNSVIRVVRAGYKIDQKVIRPADVVVSIAATSAGA